MALDAIRLADQVILGPGSLFTSVISALIVPGVTDTIAMSRGQLVFVANLVTQDGETFHMDGPGHVQALERIAGLDRTGVIVANSTTIDVPEPVRPLTYPAEEVRTLGWQLIERELVDSDSQWPQHDPVKLGAVLAELA